MLLFFLNYLFTDCLKLRYLKQKVLRIDFVLCCSSFLVFPRCLCSAGWTGADCSEDVNECESGPCLNGAQCQESHVPGEFFCTCPPFFTGPLCKQPYDPCDSLHNPCLHGSTCLTRSDGTASCRCPAGEWARRCSLRQTLPFYPAPVERSHCLQYIRCIWALWNSAAD